MTSKHGAADPDPRKEMTVSSRHDAKRIALLLMAMSSHVIGAEEIVFIATGNGSTGSFLEGRIYYIAVLGGDGQCQKSKSAVVCFV